MSERRDHGTRGDEDAKLHETVMPIMTNYKTTMMTSVWYFRIADTAKTRRAAAVCSVGLTPIPRHAWFRACEPAVVRVCRLLR